MLNVDFEAFMVNEQATADYYCFMPYEDAAISASTLLELNTNVFKICSSPPSTQPPTASDLKQSAAFLTDTTRAQREYGTKIPKLKLARFDGTVPRWQRFWDLFVYSVHKNSKLSDTNRFHYLLSLLFRAVPQAVARIEATESSYSDARGISKQRRRNSKLMERKFLDNLQMFGSMISLDHVTALRKFDVIQLNQRALSNPRVNVQWNASVLREILLKRS